MVKGVRLRCCVLLVVLTATLFLVAFPSPAVVGGQPAGPGEYPWMAAIYSGSSPANGQYCAGSLVAPTVVVSAAHCVFELLNNLAASLPVDPLGLKVKVMLGRNTLSGAGGEQITVKRVVAHPDPDVDAAVLELVSPSVQTPIAWAVPGDESLYPPATMATIIGWGDTSEGGSGSNSLLEAQVPVVSDASCSEAYGSRVVASTMVCAGHEQGGTDTCQGDSGGPMMVPDGQTMLLIGITRGGMGCARAGYPGVYAEVIAASAFIDTYA